MNVLTDAHDLMKIYGTKRTVQPKAHGDFDSISHAPNESVLIIQTPLAALLYN